MLSYKELLEVNLKGYKYSVGEMTMTRTSRSAYESTSYIVLEDDGEVCVVAEDKRRDWTQKYSKAAIARKIATGPLLIWDKEKKANVNNVEKL